eukprot:PRCOL_00000087-RA
MADWDDDDFEVDLPPLPGAAAEEKKDGLKWEGEDEEEEEPAAVASAPSVPRPAKKKTLKEKLREREEAEQRKAVERAAKVDPLADKLNKQRLVEQSDFAAAKDTFGGADAGDSALDSFLPKTEADFIEYAGMETKQISTSMTVLVNEKQKEEKAKQGDKKKKKNQKKAVVMDRDDEYEMFGPGGGNTGYADECTERFWGGWDECYPRPPEEQRCETCLGFARVKCKHCHGAGRLNYTDEPLLPKGVRPMFCPSCRGSGLAACDACWGSGVKRRPVGFSVPGTDGEA